MITYILAALALYFIQSMLPTALRYGGSMPTLISAMGPRDQKPAETPLVGRAERALANIGEALFYFIPLAILTKDIPEALLGAQIFVTARLVYLPVYLVGIPYLRTLVWTASLVGLAIMIAALL
ncbi:MAG: MAPEG family protein [Pseudomonadota bacterium]